MKTTNTLHLFVVFCAVVCVYRSIVAHAVDTSSLSASLSLSDALQLGVPLKSTYGKKLRFLSGGDFVLGGQSTGSLGAESLAGSSDLFVQRYAALSSAPLWTRMLGTASSDKLSALAVDESDSVLVAGDCFGSFDGHAHGGGYDACFAKLDSDGRTLFSGQLGGTGSDFSAAIMVEKASSTNSAYMYLVGYTNSRVFAGQTKSFSNNAVFWAKIDALTGALHSVRLFGDLTGSQASKAYGASIDAQNYVYIVGGTNTVALTNASIVGGTDAFVAKVSPAGELVWARSVGQLADDDFYSIAVHDATLFVAGNSAKPSATVNTNPSLLGQHYLGNTDVLIARLDAQQGEVQCVSLSGSASHDSSAELLYDDVRDVLFLVGNTMSAELYGEFANKSSSTSTTAAQSTMFLMAFHANNCSLRASKLLGGASGADSSGGVAMHPLLRESLLVAGHTNGAYTQQNQSKSGYFDAVVLRVEVSLPLPVTADPTTEPTMEPTVSPTLTPSARPTLNRFRRLTGSPSTSMPSSSPSGTVSFAPTTPTPTSTIAPTQPPSSPPSPSPSFPPTLALTHSLSFSPSLTPTLAPSVAPSSPPVCAATTAMPTVGTTLALTGTGTAMPTSTPTTSVALVSSSSKYEDAALSDAAIGGLAAGVCGGVMLLFAAGYFLYSLSHRATISGSKVVPIAEE